jgi:5-methylthioadenosine/S-adenosylhomocysteine deaminase
MATRLGARALHIGDLTGTLEVGKRADLILVDLSPLHNSPRFRRDRENPYAQLVYSGKASDVTDVMVNGQWLLRDRELQTLAEPDLITAAQDYARRIDAFLIEREQSVFSKLIALGGSVEEESFEVQVKVKIDSPEVVLEAIRSPEIEIQRKRHYHQHDIYFTFEDVTQGWLRYREDEALNEKGELSSVRSRLTLIGPSREGDFDHNVLLSRIRYFAPATNSLRFYREYFKPSGETPIDKDRLRWLVRYRGEDFYINLDRVETPGLGYYLEIKSRTWSSHDAQQKASSASELITFFGGSLARTITQDYVEIAEEQGRRHGTS